MQPPLHPPHIRLTDQRAQPFTRQLYRQRHPKAGVELEQNDFLEAAGNLNRTRILTDLAPRRTSGGWPRELSE
jgi:hypothetical protein